MCGVYACVRMYVSLRARLGTTLKHLYQTSDVALAAWRARLFGATEADYQPAPSDNRRCGPVRMVVVPTTGNLRSADPLVWSELENFEFKPVSGAWASPPEPQQGPCKDRRRAALSCGLRRAQTALAVVVCHPPHSPAPTALHGTCPFQCRIRDSRRPPARRARSGPCAAAACAW